MVSHFAEEIWINSPPLEVVLWKSVRNCINSVLFDGNHYMISDYTFLTIKKN